MDLMKAVMSVAKMVFLSVAMWVEQMAVPLDPM
jgi:hypothetical protein